MGVGVAVASMRSPLSLRLSEKTPGGYRLSAKTVPWKAKARSADALTVRQNPQNSGARGSTTSAPASRSSRSTSRSIASPGLPA